MADDDIDVHLGRKLRRRRRLLGMTQQELAHEVGVRFQQIQKYECAANRISAKKLWELADALNCSIEYFYEGLSRKKKKTPLAGANDQEPKGVAA